MFLIISSRQYYLNGDNNKKTYWKSHSIFLLFSKDLSFKILSRGVISRFNTIKGNVVKLDIKCCKRVKRKRIKRDSICAYVGERERDKQSFM